MSIGEISPPPALEPANSAQLREDRARFVPRGMASSSAAFAVAAEGAWVTDAEGRRYLDFATGISVLNVGHRHPRVQAVLRAQLDAPVHSGAPVMMPAAYVRLARRLAEITPGTFEKKVLLVNSGAEAVENAVKIVRQATGRSTIFTFLLPPLTLSDEELEHGLSTLDDALRSVLTTPAGLGEGDR